MMRTRWTLVVVAAAAACALRSPREPDGVELSYAERSAACVNCCDFEVHFASGGIVTFIGQRACPVPGPQRFRLPAGEFDELVRSFATARFFDIPRVAAPPMIDGGVITVTYRDRQRIHETLYNAQAPLRLKQLAARLRQAARVDEFLHPSLEKYQALVHNGWDVKTLDGDHDNALIATISAGDLASTRFLLSRGARLSDSAARLAAVRPEPAFVTIAAGAFNAAVPRRPLGPLLYEAAGRSAAHTRALLEAGADVNWRSESGRTSLINSISAGSLDTAALLLRAGAAVDARDDQGRTAMSYAASAYNSGFISMLAARGADANARDRSGRTPLMIASDGCFEWNVAPLVAAGADPLLADAEGRTALQPLYAVIGDPKCARTLRLVQAAASSRRSVPQVQ